jgi:hypothetical protein
MHSWDRKGFVIIALALLLGGCSGTRNPRVAALPTQTERVIVIVVTGTPTTEPSPTDVVPIEASLTPLSTVTPFGTPAPTEPVSTSTPTATSTPTEIPTRAPRPLAPTITPLPTAVAFNYPAPVLLSPSDRDAKRTNEDIPFLWAFSDGRPVDLGPNECYLLHVTFTSRANGKSMDGFFDTCTFPNSFSVLVGPRARFQLNRPNFAGPNYSSYMPDATVSYDVRWCVNVIRKPDNQRLGPEACLSFPMLAS